MARYKGRLSPKAIKLDFPHVIETAVPLGGLGKTLDAMYAFHTLHGIQAKLLRVRREDGSEYIRWRFADPATAKDFAYAFAMSDYLEATQGSSQNDIQNL
jgi:hypothetical protein